jgi:hypothetical protein
LSDVQESTRDVEDYNSRIYLPAMLPQFKSVKELLGDRYTKSLQDAWPDIVPPHIPCGMNIIVQLRTAQRHAGRIILADETRDAEKYRTQTALVRMLGPVAFKRRDTMEPWPEGPWCVPGAFVRVPMYGGDRVAVDYEATMPNGQKEKAEALFMTIRDGDVMGIVSGDPLGIKVLV